MQKNSREVVYGGSVSKEKVVELSSVEVGTSRV